MAIVAMNSNQITLSTPSPVKPTRIFHLTDTHLSLDDERGRPYQDFSQRMAGAYLSNSHFQTGVQQSATESFIQTLALAKAQQVDFLAITGDLFNFPSEAAIEFAYQQLSDTGIPFAFISGNHDWHYEGVPGSSQHQREVWTEKRLRPMYQANHPLYAVYHVNGLRVVCIDNSTYEILPEQLAFFRAQAQAGDPLILLMHIPLYMPGRPVGFGCGHPAWGEASDTGYDVERREKWRKGGHTAVTMDFRKAVFQTRSLVAVLAGHTHVHAVDIENGVPQIVSALNATGFYLDVKIESAQGTGN